MFWTSEEEKFLIDNIGTITAREIATKLKRSRQSIKHKSRLLGLKTNGYKMLLRSLPLFYKRKFQLDEHYFDVLNIDNCYWAGFIAADGNLSSKKYLVRISLHKKDKKHLKKFADVLKYEGKVKEYLRKNGRIETIIVFSSKIMKQILIKNFNITPNKSLTLQPPLLKDENLIKAFIRGLIDGDGCVGYAKSGLGRWSLGLAGTLAVVEWFRKHVRNFVPGLSLVAATKGKNIFNVTFTGKQIVPLLKWLYIDSKPLFRLDRKYKRALEAIKFYESRL